MLQPTLKVMKRFSLIPVLILSFSVSWANSTKSDDDETLKFVARRLAVFPLKTDETLGNQSDEVWWAVREIATRDQRFLIASQNFMVRKDVFQSRQELTPADAVILGQILDAHALIVMFIEKRVLQFIVYDGRSGQTLWVGRKELNSSIPKENQIVPGFKTLAENFMNSVPYHGFVINNPEMGVPTIERDGKKIVIVDLGKKPNVQVGDEIQFLRLDLVNISPLFQGGLQSQVVAEGRVFKLNEDNVEVELIKSSPNVKTVEMSPIRISKEYQRVRESLSADGKKKLSAPPEVYSSEMNVVEEKKAEYKPLAFVLSIFANIATFLLLAF